MCPHIAAYSWTNNLALQNIRFLDDRQDFFFLFLFFFLSLFVLRERKPKKRRGRERGEKEDLRQAWCCPCRARRRAQTHEPGDRDLSDLSRNQESDAQPTEPPRRPSIGKISKLPFTSTFLCLAQRQSFAPELSCGGP